MFRYLMIFVLFCCINSSAFALQKSDEKPEHLKIYQARDSINASGEDVAGWLTEDYNNTAENCGSDSTPAFLCSGVIIRAALPGKDFHIWDPSPTAVSTGGISFSFLRADDNSTRFVHNETSGFILFSNFFAPEGKTREIEVLCSFPLDADTINRSNQGCGAHNGNYPKSGPCQAQGITTGKQWAQNDISMDGQCGFDTRDDSPYNTAEGFMESIKARSYLTSSQAEEQNELRLATWESGMVDTLPVEAFWYIAGDSTGLSNAKTTQEDFYNTSSAHEIIPIIRITPPAQISGKFTFTFRQADQAINSK